MATHRVRSHDRSKRWPVVFDLAVQAAQRDDGFGINDPCLATESAEGASSLLDALEQAVFSDLSAYIDVDFSRRHNVAFWPGATKQQVACHTLVRSLTKKCIDRVSPSADGKALDKFLQCNNNCDEWNLMVGCERDAELIGMFRDQLRDFFTLPDGSGFVLDSHLDILHRGRVGPGSSIGARGEDFYTKLFDSELTFTRSDLMFLYQDYVSKSPLWLSAEEDRMKRRGVGRIVDASNLSFVPKSESISRTICTEPSLNMFFQLGIGQVITERLQAKFGIDLLKQQEVNRAMALAGSNGWPYVTIDLSSASDSISMRMLEEFVPRQVLYWLKLTRSTHTRVGPSRYRLHMVSSMGNGFTFPLQTAIFSCVVAACCRFRGIPWSRSSLTFSVFGDDIICPPQAADDVLRVLGILGFTANGDKTFTEGPFRESCGLDAFEGVDVRGVYVKTLVGEQARYVVANRLLLWAAQHRVVLRDSLKVLLRSIRSCFAVPPYAPLDSGLRVPLDVARQLGVRDSHHVFHENGRRVIGNRMHSWLGFKADAEVLRVSWGEPVILAENGRRPRGYNPYGLTLALLGGYMRNGKIATRQNQSPRYATKRSWSISWDQLADARGLILPEQALEAWKTSFYASASLS